MPNQTGSFGAAIGGADALKAAMSRRGMDAGILDQVSPAGGGTQVAPPLPTDTSQLNTVPATQPQAPGGTPATPTVPFRSGEMEIALKALKGVADTESKIAKAMLGL